MVKAGKTGVRIPPTPQKNSKENHMWTINWVLLIGSYIFITIVMFFEVQGWFGYIMGTITLAGTIGLIYTWVTYPTPRYTPSQDIIKKTPRRRGRYY